MSMNLTERQQQVLACVMDAHKEGSKPTMRNIVARMVKKDQPITERQCTGDLKVIIYTNGTGVISARYGNSAAIYIYDEGVAKAATKAVKP
jgi:hypothetical protein